jgi:hypothetical protein
MNKTFKPSQGQIQAAKNLMMTMAHQQLVEPIVTAYQRDILTRNQWRCNPETKALGCQHDVITEPKLAYLLSDTDAAMYYALCDEAKVASGLKVSKPENCPLLEATTLVLDAQRAMVAEMQPTTGVTWDQLMNNFSKLPVYIDLTLKLLAPFVGKADDILNDLVAKA